MEEYNIFVCPLVFVLISTLTWSMAMLIHKRKCFSVIKTEKFS